MSVIIQTRGEVGGGATAHLQCPSCGHFSKSHAQELSHMASAHPSCLDDVSVGRLGNILMFQSTARLFHCATCFYTSRDFTKLYKHIITKHCEDGGGNRREKEKTGEQGEEEAKESLKRKRGCAAEAEGEQSQEEVTSPKPESVTPDGEGGGSILVFDGTSYCCSICSWKNKHKILGLNHVVRKHNLPKAYTTRAIRRNAASHSGGAEEDEIAGLSRELLKAEVEATAKVIRFVANRFVCLTCGWKTKLKGFAISHVIRSHDVVRPYSCKDCTRSFFLPSHLQQHIRSTHRPGRYACPFCCFRSHFLVGFRRHCSRCNAREEEGGRGVGRREDKEANQNNEEEEGREERKDTRAERRRRKVMMMKDRLVVRMK